MIIAVVRALVLYHLAEYQSGNATTIKVNIQNHTFRVSDNGRGHAIDRTINDLPYLRLVYSQLEYPFGLETDTPIQLHTIGISLINSLCRALVVTIHKPEKTYIQHYKQGQLNKEEIMDNQETVTGTAIEGKINPDLFPEEIDLQNFETWLKEIKSIHQQLRLFFNEKEL
jgi:DNA gyrase/topoisomerase IV subunit B